MTAFYQYKIELLSLSEKVGFATWDASDEIATRLGDRLNALAAEGWELMAVVPVNRDGNNPTFDQRGYHYFRKMI